MKGNLREFGKWLHARSIFCAKVLKSFKSINCPNEIGNFIKYLKPGPASTVVKHLLCNFWVRGDCGLIPGEESFFSDAI